LHYIVSVHSRQRVLIHA